MKVSFYKDSSDSTGQEVDFKKITSAIKTGKYAGLIKDIRSTKDVKDRDALKRSLPSFTAAGVFYPTRGLYNCTEPSGLMILDVDDKVVINKRKVKQYSFVEEIWHDVATDIHTHAAFISPGGNGMKIITKIGKVQIVDGDGQVSEGDVHTFPERIVDIYRAAFEKIRLHYAFTYGITLDRSGKNVNRICYMSHDSDIVLRSSYKLIDILIEPPKEYVRQEGTEEVRDASALECMEFAVNCVNKNGSYFVDSNRNNFIFYLSCTLNRFGVYFDDTLQLVALYYGVDTMNKEDEWYKTIRSAYTNNRREFNTYPVKTKIRRRNGTTA